MTSTINTKISMSGQDTNLNALVNGKQYNLFVLLMNRVIPRTCCIVTDFYRVFVVGNLGILRIVCFARKEKWIIIQFMSHAIFIQIFEH